MTPRMLDYVTEVIRGGSENYLDCSIAQQLELLWQLRQDHRDEFTDIYQDAACSLSVENGFYEVLNARLYRGEDTGFYFDFYFELESKLRYVARFAMEDLFEEAKSHMPEFTEED